MTSIFHNSDGTRRAILWIDDRFLIEVRRFAAPTYSGRLVIHVYPKETIGDVIDWTYSGNKLHPTQKPLSVLLPLVETFSPLCGTVLDPFAGSGSSLLAAKMLGRSYVGIELDAKYHAIATRRLS
jgi:DNA modification methylase